MPKTIFELIDQSAITPAQVTGTRRPLFMCGITSDKGPEDLRVVTVDLFQKLYGKVSFAKHGQPLLQADRILNSGGDILVKRVVASDSKLANTMVVAKIKKSQVQKTDAEGKPLYLLSGEETTDPSGAEPIMLDVAHVKMESQTVTGADSIDAVKTAATSVLKEVADSDGFKVYPLFAITDIGRGKSNKKFRISPDYDGSKNLDFLQYKIDIIENSELIENIKFSFNPDTMYSNVNYSLMSTINSVSNQVRAVVFESYTDLYFAELKTISGVSDTFINEDVLFGKTIAGSSVSTIEFDASSINLNHVYGIALSSGDNGAFGDAPITTDDTYETEMVKLFNGTSTSEIYDLNSYMIDAIVDAGYPSGVKRAIEGLVNYREDGFYFRDLGLVYTFDQIKAAQALGSASKLCNTLHLSYDTIDPYTGKQIRVTAGYSLAKILPNHFKGGRNRPLAGEINGAILSDAIKGTVNYVPVVTPSIDQKQQLEDIRVNYASWFGNNLIIETQFTSQTKFTQFSYTNNILAIQEVVKAIRERCPKNRYSFIDGADLETYKNDVQAVINNFVDNFREIKFEYIQDATMVQNKIFYAAIKVKFRNYVESEYFKIYALN